MSKKLLLIVSILFFLSACTEQELLVSEVNERSSVEIMVVLQESGIAAERIQLSSGRESRFKIQVRPAEYSQALNILHQYGLPKSDQDSLASITKPEGFSPNPPEIAALRLDHAIALEIERMLSGFPGVIEVKSLVRSNLKLEGVAPQVSVVIRYVSISDNLPFSVEAVRKLIVQSVPGVDSAEVNLAVNRISSFAKNEGEKEFINFSPFHFEIKKTQRNLIQKQLSLFLGVICFFAGLVGILLGWKFSKRSAQRLEGSKSNIESSGVQALPDAGRE